MKYKILTLALIAIAAAFLLTLVEPAEGEIFPLRCVDCWPMYVASAFSLRWN